MPAINQGGRTLVKGTVGVLSWSASGMGGLSWWGWSLRASPAASQASPAYITEFQPQQIGSHSRLMGAWTGSMRAERSSEGPVAELKAGKAQLRAEETSSLTSLSMQSCYCYLFIYLLLFIL